MRQIDSGGPLPRTIVKEQQVNRSWLTTLSCWLALGLAGCASVKESDTSRTGIEQLLISEAVDRSLDRVDFTAARGAKVYVEEKYLDCVDKNYVLMSLHHRLLSQQCTLVGKAEEADLVMEVASGAVGTDRQDLFAGIPQIPLPPPSPISVPKMAFFERHQGERHGQTPDRGL